MLIRVYYIRTGSVRTEGCCNHSYNRLGLKPEILQGEFEADEAQDPRAEAEKWLRKEEAINRLRKNYFQFVDMEEILQEEIVRKLVFSDT